MNKRMLRILILLLSVPQMLLGQCPGKQGDWKRAIWRVPLHMVVSAPVAATSLIIPPVGKKYMNWRIRAEKNDVAMGKDTPMKASVDLYSQTALVHGVLKMYGIKTEDDTLPPCTFSRKGEK